MRTSMALLITVAALCSGTASAQSSAAPPAPAFEMATVHVSAPRASRRPPVFRGDRFEARGQTLVNLIAFAYGVNVDRVVGGPNWLDFDRFDIVARTPGAPSPEERRQMVRTLLAERFQLELRHENQPQEAWALVRGPGALRVTRAEGVEFTGCRPIPQAAGATAVIQEVECRNVTMAQIAARFQALSWGYFEGPVSDATGLDGTWDARIAVTPASARAAANEGTSVFDAAERLGLRLERRDTPVPVLVVVGALQEPTPNAPGAVDALVPVTPGEFELAVVRPIAPGSELSVGGPTIQPNGRIILRMTLRELIAFAWNVPPDLVVGGPGFVATERFELVGQAPPWMPRPLGEDEFRPMLRSLLAARFGLAVHEALREAEVYVLAARRQIRMSAGSDLERGWCRSTPERIPPNSGLSAAVTCRNTTMAQLADRLPGMAPNYINGRPVFDETGLAGTFDFLVLWTGLAAINGRVNALQPGDREEALAMVGTLTLFDALDRLGLKLSPEKRLLPAVVIARVQRTPTEN